MPPLQPLITTPSSSTQNHPQPQLPAAAAHEPLPQGRPQQLGSGGGGGSGALPPASASRPLSRAGGAAGLLGCVAEGAPAGQWLQGAAISSAAPEQRHSRAASDSGGSAGDEGKQASQRPSLGIDGGVLMRAAQMDVILGTGPLSARPASAGVAVAAAGAGDGAGADVKVAVGVARSLHAPGSAECAQSLEEGGQQHVRASSRGEMALGGAEAGSGRGVSPCQAHSSGSPLAPVQPGWASTGCVDAAPVSGNAAAAASDAQRQRQLQVLAARVAELEWRLAAQDSELARQQEELAAREAELAAQARALSTRTSGPSGLAKKEQQVVVVYWKGVGGSRH